MFKEFINSKGDCVFCFVGIDPYNYILDVFQFFESKFNPTSKISKSGWHSTIMEYQLSDVIITISDLNDVLCITLQSPINEARINLVRKWVEIIDEEIQKTNKRNKE